MAQRDSGSLSTTSIFSDIIPNSTCTLIKPGSSSFQKSGSSMLQISTLGGAGVVHKIKTPQNYAELKAELFLTQNSLFEDPEFPPCMESIGEIGENLGNVNWLRPTQMCLNPEFITDGLSKFNLSNSNGYSHIMDAFAAISNKSAYFTNVIPPDQSFAKDKYAGIFHFRFWLYGKWVDVVIDDQLPKKMGNRNFLFLKPSDRSNEYWGPLLEKAFAKLHGSYSVIFQLDFRRVLESLTGGLSELMNDLPHQHFHKLWKAHNRNAVILARINVAMATQQEMDFKHAYTITKVCFVDSTSRKYARPINTGVDSIKLVRLRNPWTTDEWKGDFSPNSEEWKYIKEDSKKQLDRDSQIGDFWMFYYDFADMFDEVIICHKHPLLFDSMDGNLTTKKWVVQNYEGKWISHRTNGGHEEPWRNPQYVVEPPELDTREVKEKNDDNEIIFSVLTKDSVGPGKPSTCLSIYHSPKAQDIRKPPLPQEWFDQHQELAVVRDTNECVISRKIQKGAYLVIPFTDPPSDGEFLLRVFIDSKATK